MTNDSAGIKAKTVGQAEGLEVEDVKEMESSGLGPSWLWSEKRELERLLWSRVWVSG